ncbi:MAG: hypothetical protein ACHQDF_05155 [Chitinophagales bacterium]
MKTGLLPVLNLLISIIAIGLCFIPMVLFWIKRLAPDKSYLFIALFWLINGITYTPEIFCWQWYHAVSNDITLLYNLMDTPLILLIFYFSFKKKIFLRLLYGFLLFEIAMILWKGYNFDSNTPIIGLGSLISLILNIWGISVFFKKMQHTAFENVLAFVNAGFIFYYGLFTVIYIFNYLNFSMVTLPYVTFINYISITIATGLISYGYWRYGTSPWKEANLD